MSESVDIIFVEDNDARCNFFAEQADVAHGTLNFRVRRDLHFAKDPASVIDALFGPSTVLGQIVLLDLELVEGKAKAARDELERRGLLVPELRAGRWPVPVLESMRTALAIGAALIERRARPIMLLMTTTFDSSPVLKYLIRGLTQSYIRAAHLRSRFPIVELGMQVHIDHLSTPCVAVGLFGGDIRVETTDNLARACAAFEHLFLNERLAKVAAAPWRALRENLWAASTELARANEFDGLNHELWAHHLPEGGDVMVAAYADWLVKVHERCLAAIREVIPMANTLELPIDQFDWRSCSTIPWRAMVQFDGMAQDLTKALRMIAGHRSCGDKSVIIEVNAPDGVTAQGNCLWCNALCIAEQIQRLADCFCGYLREEQPPISTFKAASRFSVAAVLGISNVSLTITQSVSLDDGTYRRIPLPAPGSLECRNNIEAVYGSLVEAGATLKAADGVLTISINADLEKRRTLDGKRPTVWMVRGGEGHG